MRKNRTNSSGKSLYGKRRKGFTIVELVIVIAVIAILAAVLVPTLSAVVQKAKDSQELQNEKANETNYIASDSTVIGEDFDITKPLTEYYDILSFDAPTLLSTYNQNKERHDGTTTSESYFAQQTTAYYVGDDNEFIFEPIMTARHIVTYEILTLTGFNVKVEVTLKGPQDVELTGEKQTDGTIQFSNSGTTYVTFNPETYGFQFTESALSKSFTLKMTLLDSYYDTDTQAYNAITTDYYKNTISPFEMTVTVADGWNVYNALDLGRMCITSNSYNADNYHRGKSAAYVYYNATSGQMEPLNYSSIWQDFLKDKYQETTLTPVNGIFIHSNITVTNSDIPEEYIVSSAEAIAKGVNYSDMVGSIRDWSLLYIHYMENSDFTFNGNLFKIDFSNLKWGMSNSSASNFYYAETGATKYAGHSTAFAFAGARSGSTYTVSFTNAESTGNSNGILNANDNTGENASGSLMFMKSIHTNTKVDNCITKNYLIAYFTEICTTSIKGLEISNTKIYDCYNSGLFAWESPNNTVTNCELKRFGGSAVMLVGGSDGEQKANTTYTYTAGGFTITSSTIENNVSGDEAWFDLNGASQIATSLVNLNDQFSTYSKTFLNSNKELNLYAICLDTGYMSATNATLYTNFAYNLDGTTNNTQLYLSGTEDSNTTIYNTILDETAGTGDSSKSTAIYSAIASSNRQAPIFMTDNGIIFTTNGSSLTQVSGTLSDISNANTLYVIYPLGSTVTVAIALQLNSTN